MIQSITKYFAKYICISVFLEFRILYVWFIDDVIKFPGVFSLPKGLTFNLFANKYLLRDKLFMSHLCTTLVNRQFKFLPQTCL